MSIPSFGGSTVGTPPTTAQQSYQFEAPEIQARKLGLMDIAGQLAQGQTGTFAGLQIPTQQMAGFAPQQQQAFDLASQGIGGTSLTCSKRSNTHRKRRTQRRIRIS